MFDIPCVDMPSMTDCAGTYNTWQWLFKRFYQRDSYTATRTPEKVFVVTRPNLNTEIIETDLRQISGYTLCWEPNEVGLQHISGPGLSQNLFSFTYKLSDVKVKVSRIIPGAFALYPEFNQLAYFPGETIGRAVCTREIGDGKGERYVVAYLHHASGEISLSNAPESFGDFFFKHVQLEDWVVKHVLNIQAILNEHT
jgi:hypothetical protein